MFIDRYGHWSKQDQINNKELMEREWILIDRFEALATQIMEVITYAQFAQAPIFDMDIIDIAIGIIM